MSIDAFGHSPAWTYRELREGGLVDEHDNPTRLGQVILDGKECKVVACFHYDTQFAIWPIKEAADTIARLSTGQPDLVGSIAHGLRCGDTFEIEAWRFVPGPDQVTDPTPAERIAEHTGRTD